MAELDKMAEERLREAKLPTYFSYKQAFILGYNARKMASYRIMYGERLNIHPLENHDMAARALGYGDD